MTGDVRNSDEATLEQVLSRIAALAPMIARLAPDTEQTRRQPTERFCQISRRPED
jgi:hypothetical protein